MVLYIPFFYNYYSKSKNFFLPTKKIKNILPKKELEGNNFNHQRDIDIPLNDLTDNKNNDVEVSYENFNDSGEIFLIIPTEKILEIYSFCILFLLLFLLLIFSIKNQFFITLTIDISKILNEDLNEENLSWKKTKKIIDILKKISTETYERRNALVEFIEALEELTTSTSKNKIEITDKFDDIKKIIPKNNFFVELEN
jgi:hypothetical protein